MWVVLELDDGKTALIVKRMDRVDGWNHPMEDMSQLRDRLSDEKYRVSMESIGKIILKHCANPGFDALRFFEVTLFCFLTGNADMHFKNFSLIRATDGEMHYAAAYDLLPTTLLLSQDTEESALTIHGKKSRLRWLDFLAFGSAFQLTERQMVNAIGRFEKGVARCNATHYARVLLRKHEESVQTTRLGSLGSAEAADALIEQLFHFFPSIAVRF